MLCLFELRPAEPSDEPFLFELYASTHGQQLATLPLASQQRDALMRMQFDAQRTGYGAQFPASQDFVMMLAGERAGRLWLDESGEATRVIDIVVGPAHQGRGLGRAVLDRVILHAAEWGRPVRLSVSRMNARAFDLYCRLGFEVCGEDQMNIEMKHERNPLAHARGRGPETRAVAQRFQKR